MGVIKDSAMLDETDDNFDDFMDGIGLDVKPVSPEDALLILMKSGNGNKLHLLRYWLIHELHCYHNAVKNGVIYMKRNSETLELQPFTKNEYINLRIKYYLNMYFLPWFDSDQSKIGKVQYDPMVKLILEQEVVESLVRLPYDEIPKLSY